MSPGTHGVTRGWRRYFDGLATCDNCGGETGLACLLGNEDESVIACPACIRRYAGTIPAEKVPNE